ncbi:MAG: sulfotransferase family 2 domain-containing protein [Methyloceanibacter sp.]
MIISHEHKFIFLKTKKTAGTSIELALSQLCGPDDIIAPITEGDEALRAVGSGPRNWRVHGWWQSPRPLFERRWLKFSAQDYGFYNHMPANEARALLADDKIWRSYFKFAFDRNPWDRQVSAYHFRYRDRARPPSFADFLDHDRRARLNNYEIYSLDGEVCVDFLGRFESLAADLRKALKEVGLDFDQELPRAKANLRHSRKHYRDYYDEESRDIVGTWYAPEIALLGYEF